jgi:tetratricopeptide (TPR) repeat protein
MKIHSFLAAALLCLALPLAAAEEPSLLKQGETLLNEGKLPEAFAALQQAVVAEPNSSRAFQRLGGAQLMSQDYAGSIQSFQRAISLDANNADAFVGMAMAYIHGGPLWPGPLRPGRGQAHRPRQRAQDRRGHCLD